jgi:hypothetical protein
MDTSEHQDMGHIKEWDFKKNFNPFNSLKLLAHMNR